MEHRQVTPGSNGRRGASSPGLGLLSQHTLSEGKNGSIWKCTSRPASWICQCWASAAFAFTKNQVQSYYGSCDYRGNYSSSSVHRDSGSTNKAPRSLPSAEEVHNCSLKAPSCSSGIKQNQQPPRKEKADANQNVLFVPVSLLGTGWPALSHHRDVVAAKNPWPYLSPGVTLMVVLTRAVTQLFISNSNYFLKLPLKEVSVSQQEMSALRPNSSSRRVWGGMGLRGRPGLLRGGLKGAAGLWRRGAGDSGESGLRCSS